MKKIMICLLFSFTSLLAEKLTITNQSGRSTCFTVLDGVNNNGYTIVDGGSREFKVSSGTWKIVVDSKTKDLYPYRRENHYFYIGYGKFVPLSIMTSPFPKIRELYKARYA